MAKYHVVIIGEDGAGFDMDLTQEEAATIDKLVDRYSEETKDMKYAPSFEFYPKKVEKIAKTYPCDNGGCPYDAMYVEDCRTHCGLGVDDDKEEDDE